MAAADQSSESERGARETDKTTHEEPRRGCTSGRKEGERRLGCIDGVRKIAPARAFVWAVFFFCTISLEIFIFLSLPFNFFIFVHFIFIISQDTINGQYLLRSKLYVASIFFNTLILLCIYI